MQITRRRALMGAGAVVATAGLPTTANTATTAAEPSPALEKLPNWPRWLNQRQAAAYLGVSPGKFRAECLAGVWPGPRRGKLWDRRALDAASDRLSNLSTATEDEEIRYGRDPGYIKRLAGEARS